MPLTIHKRHLQVLLYLSRLITDNLQSDIVFC